MLSKPVVCPQWLEVGSMDGRCIEHTLPLSPFVPIGPVPLAGTDLSLFLFLLFVPLCSS